MKWYKTIEKLPETNKQLLLFIKGACSYPEYYEMEFTNVVMGVYLKNELYNQKDAGCLSEREYYFEGLCCGIHLPNEEIIAWSYLPSVKEIEEFLLEKQ
jgi:hypothetical protein